MINKRIVFCENAVETLTYFSRQLAQAFASWGYECFWMDFEKLGLSAWKLRQEVAERKKETVLLTFNFIGLSGEAELWETDDAGEPVVSLWDKLGIRCLSLMVDHPIYYYQALQIPPADLQTFCVDRDHVAYMHRFYQEIPCSFLPLAGNCLIGCDAPAADLYADHEGGLFEQEPDVQALYEQWLKRPYPLVFTANYVPLSNIDRQLARMGPEYRNFYYEMIESFVQDPKQELFTCIEKYLRREMPDLSDAELCAGMSSMPAVDLWVRTYFREKTVRILAQGGIEVHLFGKDWEQIVCDCPRALISAGRMVTSADCVQAMAQAKLALNTMPWFKDGAHDRIFTAMLQGTASLTDDSVYLRERFTHMDTIVYYDLSRLEELPEQVGILLREPERLFAVSCRGKAAAQQLDQWKNRAQLLRQYIQ